VLLTVETSVGFPLSPVGRVILTVGQSTLAHLGMTSRSAKGRGGLWKLKGFWKEHTAVGISKWKNFFARSGSEQTCRSATRIIYLYCK
jgi:hypothetical protein